MVYIREQFTGRMKHLIRMLISAAVIALASPVAAQYADGTELTAMPVESVIRLDGNLDEDVWSDVPRATNFIQRELEEGAPASERTEVAVVYTVEALYIGVWCYDSNPDKIIAKEMRRDFNHDLDDNFIVVIDTYHDRRNGFMFVTNPNGARGDRQIFNNGGSTNAFWDGVWEVATTRTAEGWFAEFRIPFSTLKYRSGEAGVWGINFERNIRHKREQVRWQGWQRNYGIENVSRAGLLRGLRNLSDDRFIELKPYGLAGAQREEGENTAVLNAGGDVNYLISPTYRLNLSFNTDFAQVESDEQQVNLTRFPLFFDELREFFLEGEDYFDFSFGGNRIVPFYSRRIGLNDEMETVPIIAAGRLLGKERNTTLGLMSLQTAEEGSQPSTNYTVAGWRQDVGKQSVIGANTANKFADGRWHTTTGVNGQYSTSELFGNKNFDIGGAAIGTYDTDSGYNDMAWAYRLFASFPNDLINAFVSTQRSPAPFNPEIGLLRRSNFRESFFQLAIRPRPKKSMRWIKQFDFSPGTVTYTQYDDNQDLQTLEYIIRPLGFETRTGEVFTLEYRVLAEGFREDFEIFPDVIVPEGTYWWRDWKVAFSSFSGRDLSVAFDANAGEYLNGRAVQGNVDLVWRTSKHINLSVKYGKNYIDLESGRFETDLAGARIEYAVNPNIFGSLFGQWNSAAEELNVNFRLHVIPKVGTDFYLIYNQFMNTHDGVITTDRSTVLAKLIWRFVV